MAKLAGAIERGLCWGAVVLILAVLALTLAVGLLALVGVMLDVSTALRLCMQALVGAVLALALALQALLLKRAVVWLITEARTGLRE